MQKVFLFSSVKFLWGKGGKGPDTLLIPPHTTSSYIYPSPLSSYVMKNTLMDPIHTTLLQTSFNAPPTPVKNFNRTPGVIFIIQPKPFNLISDTAC